jgi:hypothetical protein
MVYGLRLPAPEALVRLVLGLIVGVAFSVLPLPIAIWYEGFLYCES